MHNSEMMFLAPLDPPRMYFLKIKNSNATYLGGTNALLDHLDERFFNVTLVYATQKYSDSKTATAEVQQYCRDHLEKVYYDFVSTNPISLITTKRLYVLYIYFNQR